MKNYVKPYTSRGKRISKSSHHDDLWIVDIIGTNQFYSVTMSTNLMLKNNPPDPILTGKQKLKALDNAQKFSHLVLPTNTGRFQSKRKNVSQRPKGLADVR